MDDYKHVPGRPAGTRILLTIEEHDALHARIAELERERDVTGNFLDSAIETIKSLHTARDHWQAYAERAMTDLDAAMDVQRWIAEKSE